MPSPAWQQHHPPPQGQAPQGQWPPPGTPTPTPQGQMQRPIFPGYLSHGMQHYRPANQLTPPGTSPMPSSPNLPVQPMSPNVGQPPPGAMQYGHVRWQFRPEASLLGARPANSSGQPQWILPQRPPSFLYPPNFYPRQDGLHAVASFRPLGEAFPVAPGVWSNPGVTAHPELPDLHAHRNPVIGGDKVSDSKSEKTFKIEVSEDDSWTAHKTDDGNIYYYNSVTGESTYEKPASFRGEANVNSQPTPVACDKLPGTEWLLVTTNDGKKYYYNPKTQATSWQVPAEIVEKAKKDDAATISTPAALTGGREAKGTVTNPLTALDTVKKKLHDSTASISEPEAANDEAVKDKLEVATSDSSSDSDDDGPTVSKEEQIQNFKEMLKEKGVAPFSKWDRELPKIIIDPRFKAIPSHSERRSIFEHYVRTRADEERKEKRAAQKAAVEAFKQLLDEASANITSTATYESFASAWSQDPRFDALDRKDRETLLNERVLPLKKAEEDRQKAVYDALASEFHAMLKERNDITVKSRWSKFKDLLRHDPRYKAVEHDTRESLFNAYINGLRAVEQEAERAVKAKRDEENKLKEREREFRKRKERDEQELDRVRAKARRKDAVTAYQALLTEKIKDADASWTESRPKLEKDSLGRATNPELDLSDLERLFRDHVKELYERYEKDYRSLLSDVLTPEAAAKHAENGKDVLGSWSDAKDVLKSDHRYNRMPRRSREVLWHRHTQDVQRRSRGSGDKDKDEMKDSVKSTRRHR